MQCSCGGDEYTEINICDLELFSKIQSLLYSPTDMEIDDVIMTLVSC